MQSSWQRIAREAFRWTAQRPANCRTIGYFLTSKPKVSQEPITRYNQYQKMVATASLRVPEAFLPTELTPFARSEVAQGGVLEASLSPAQRAFSAASAIRLLVAEGNLSDAYLILNSLYFAKNQSSSPLWHTITGLLHTNALNSRVIPFSPETPIRLVAHSLLHSLLQHGHRKEAADFSKSLVENDIKIHWKSLDTVFNALTDSYVKEDMVPVKFPLLASKNVLTTHLEPSLLSHLGAARALDLLHVIRKSRQRRTSNMFRALIALCIINGEIIMASLIFGIMVRDWNSHVTEVLKAQPGSGIQPHIKPGGLETPLANALSGDGLRLPISHTRPCSKTSFAEGASNATTDSGSPKNHVAEAFRTQDDSVPPLVPPKPAPDEPPKALPFPTPRPRPSDMKELLVSIETILKRREKLSDIRHAQQALANLSLLVEARLIPFSHLSQLLNVIARGQRSLGTVNIPVNESPETTSKDVAVFFGDVLHNLAYSLPSVHGTSIDVIPPPIKNEGFLPALDAESYCQLLSYALLQLRCTPLADVIISHMSNERKPILRGPKVDLMTSEIFARAALELKSEALWDRAVSLNLKGAERVNHSKSSSIAERYAALLPSIADDPCPYPMASRIDFLVSSGHPQLVKQYLSYILPGLRHRPDRPRKLEPSQQGELRLNDLRLAVMRGPRVITSVLNALCKTGSTGAMSDVWRWAKEVEQDSWTFKEQEGLRPWSLSKKPYTLMLTALGAEVRRGMIFGLEKQPNGEMALVRRDRAGENGKTQRAIGFGHRQPRVEGLTDADLSRYNFLEERHEAALIRARGVYRSAMAARDLFYEKQQRHLGPLHPHHELPVPDEYFFNAMLDIVGRNSWMLPRSPTPDLGLADWYVRGGEKYWEETGTLPRPVHQDLLDVGKDILDAGFPIPPSLRVFFVGHGIDYRRNEIPMTRWRGRSLYRLMAGGKGRRTQFSHRSQCS